jgi:predicted regulator of Ras-like GTPase activity (Roadblock/LC7/MglB family)
MGTTKAESSVAQGFEGAVAGLSLADVIQLNGNNGFSGCITVQYENRTGRIFFRDGRIVHAEQGAKSGEEAFYEVMEWSTGRFSLEPNVSTTSHTIDKHVQFILLEAHRLMDERRAGRLPPSEGAAEPPPQAARAPTLADRMKHVPGVTSAVLMNSEGACVEETSPGSEALAGRAAFLGLVGNRIGRILSAGPLQSATLQGSDARPHVLLLTGKTHNLGVLVDADADVNAVEVGVRRAFGAAR